MPLHQFEVSLEEVLHDRYLTLYNRRVRFSAPGQELTHEMNFDVIGHPQSGEGCGVVGVWCVLWCAVVCSGCGAWCMEQ